MNFYAKIVQTRNTSKSFSRFFRFFFTPDFFHTPGDGHYDAGDGHYVLSAYLLDDECH